jgi:MFS family permease
LPTPTTARRAALVLPVACGATFLAFLDSTIANLAIPDLNNTFHGAGVTNLSWVITLYVITFAALLSPAGRLADLLGRRRVFAAGVALFTLCSVLAAAAPTFGVLLVARAAQGVGAAAMIPASLGLILTSVAPERRSAAIGLWSASAAAAAAFGPPIGGLVVDQFGWRALFALNLPVGLAMLAGARSIPETERAEGRLPDVIGTVLLGTGIGLLVLGVTQGATWGWGNGRTLAALTVGAVMLRASLLRSRSHPAPALEIGCGGSARLRPPTQCRSASACSSTRGCSTACCSSSTCGATPSCAPGWRSHRARSPQRRSASVSDAWRTG